MSGTGGAQTRRGLVILVVMVVVTLTALVGSSILLTGDVAVAAAVNDGRVEQSRLAAWSGVQAVMSRLHAQRDDLLEGASPVIPESWTFPLEQGWAPAFRVSGSDGLTLAQSENAKIDVNLATVEMLAAAPTLDEDLARKIVAARPFGSIAELTRVDGITPEMVYGIDGYIDEQPGPGVGEADRADELSGGAGALRDVLTVFSFDPNVQLGLGEGGEGRLGDRRINLAMAWSDRVREAVVDRWDEDVAAFLERLFEQGETLRSTSDVVALMRRLGAPAESWVGALDAVTTTDGEHVRGLVDLNRASATVLAMIPGIDEGAARAIVEARERIGIDERRSIVWPVIEGALSEEAFTQACDWLTTRSTQWRVRVTGGVRNTQAADGSREARLRDRVTYECVIDVSSRRPRVAYLREVTALAYALSLREPDPPTAIEPDIGLDGSQDEPWTDDPARPEDGDWTPDRSPEQTREPAGSGDARARPAGRIGRWRVGAGGDA